MHGTALPMTLASGRMVMITAAGLVIDLATGAQMLDILGPGLKKPGNYSGHTVLGSPAVVGDIVVLQPEITDAEIAALTAGNEKKKKSAGYSAFAGYRISEQGGKLIAEALWRVPNINSYDVSYCSSVVIDGKVVVQTKNGHLRVFDPVTGACDFRQSPDGDVRKPKPYIERVGHGMWVAPSATAKGFYLFTHQGHWATYDRSFKKAGSGKLMRMGGAPGFDATCAYIRTGTEVIAIGR